MDGHAAGRKHAAMAARERTCAPGAYARVLPAQQPDAAPDAQLFMVAAWNPLDRSIAHSLAVAIQPLLVSMGVMVGPPFRAACRAPFSCNRPRTTEGISRYLLKNRTLEAICGGCLADTFLSSPLRSQTGA